MDSTAGMSITDLHESMVDDIQRFTSLFHLHDEANLDQELRQKYKIGMLEKEFRADHAPEKRKELTRLRAITTFFLNRIKERAI